MNRIATTVIVVLGFFIFLTIICYSDEQSRSQASIGNSEEQSHPKLLSTNDSIKNVIKRNKLQGEGRILAEQGRYDEAIDKFLAATDPMLLNNKGDKSLALCAIRDIYVRQGRLNEALEFHEQKILPLNPEKEQFINTRIELLALIKARDTKDNAPIYKYIDYIKSRYSNMLPPKGYVVGFSDSLVCDLIHLYDYTHDYYGGIIFMDEVIKHLVKKGWMNDVGGRKTINEYQRVKHAWELDKQTGQHGHLQDVIKTSDVISW